MTIRLSRPVQVGAFVVIVAAAFVIAGFSLANILRWSSEPQAGYFVRATGRAPTVGLVLTEASEAGLKVGDRLLTVNGDAVTSLGGIRKLRRTGLAATNTYTVQRGDRQLEIVIRSRPLGLRDTLIAYGFPWAVGVVFMVLGGTVFLMKPFDRAAWAFLLFSCVTGTFVLFIHRNVLTPGWLNTVSMASLAFLPAVMLHLALTFPEERSWLARHRVGLFLPYALSLILTVLLQRSSPIWEDIQIALKIAWISYLAVAVVGMLGSTMYTHRRTASSVTRLRARVILLGFGLATCVPVAESALNAVFDAYVLPHSSWLLPFFIFVPVSVGYAIVKHNLFDIDAVIRRTTGWVLLTGVLIALYVGLLGVFNLAFRHLAPVPSPVSGLVVMLILIVMLNPLRDRVQGLVDRIFYRTPSDYQKTVRAMSEALTSIISLDTVIARLVNTLTVEMFISTAAVLLRSGPRRVYRTLGSQSEKVAGISLEESSLLAQLFLREKVAILDRDAVAEDPKYEGRRADYLAEFDRVGATLLVPLIFTGELIGLLVVGDKLSGRSFTAEDVALLRTLAHEGAIAINNAIAFRRIEDLTSTLEDRVRRRTEELAIVNVKLEESNARLKELDQLKSEFVSDVAHELRTPLTSIRGYLEYILDGVAGAVAPGQRALLERARDNAARLTRLIADLLDLARIEAGRVELQRARVSLRGIVEEVVDDLRVSAAAKEVDLRPQGVDLIVAADRDKLHQILLNLVHNAVKFTPPGGSVEVRAEEGSQGDVVIVVEDTGDGIAAEDLGRIFERFSRVGESGLTSKGSGLGLTITRKLVELHGGGIGVTSVPGRGSAFVVTLPGADRKCP